jgi:branched-chain amino acid transport system permease protein
MVTSPSNIAHAGVDPEGSNDLPPSRPMPGAPRQGMAILRDALGSALVALGLFGLLVGLRLEPSIGRLGLSIHPVALAAIVAAVFMGRIGLLLWQSRAATQRITRPSLGAPRWLTPALLMLAITLPLFAGRYWVDLGTLILIYTMLGWGLNIVVGLAGLLDLGYVAFYAVGAYSCAILTTRFGLGFWNCLPIAGILASFWGVCLGFPVLRLRGDYLAIVTLAFGEIIRITLINAVSLTGGPNGISGIPRPTLFGWHVSVPSQRVMFLYYVILGLALLTNAATLRLKRLPLGRAWEALREDEIACRALGINVTITKLTAFAIGAMFAGFAGAFFAARAAFVSPESFTFIESALVLAIVVLGGLGSQLGTALAALAMIGGSEMLRDFAQYRMLVFGLALVVVMIARPQGAMTQRAPCVLLQGQLAGSGS